MLCFQRQDEQDLVLNGHKVLGSAQRRRRGAILQHGGLLLKASKFAPDLPGIIDLTTGVDLTDLEQSVSTVLSAQISESTVQDSLTETEREFARRSQGQPMPTPVEKSPGNS
jgi:lipoate-protein ligase A